MPRPDDYPCLRLHLTTKGSARFGSGQASRVAARFLHTVRSVAGRREALPFSLAPELVLGDNNIWSSGRAAAMRRRENRSEREIMAKRPKRSTGLGEDPVQRTDPASIIPIEHIQGKILLIRGQKVILDSDLAELYGVATSRLNEQVKRNIERFPSDFAFRLTSDEFADLKSHFAISSSTWGGRRKLPYAFTEHGVIMAASVLNSDRAVQASVFVVRAFVQLKQMLVPYKELAAKLLRLEQRVQSHDEDIVAIVDAIRLLMPPPEEPPPEPFGFRRAKKN